MLNSLCRRHISPSPPFSFACRPQGVFDNLELLSVAQIRQLYSILSVLAYGHEDEELETGIQDELHVIIRKQLFHDEQRLV